jgi:DNA-binding SARP family transcriptional activator
MLRLHLLGTPSIYDDAGEIRLSSQKAQALLYYLAADAERSFARGQLIALLWEESAEREGRNSLSTVLTRLRRALPAVPIRAEGDTLAWQPAEDIWVDLHDAQRLLQYPCRAASDPAEPPEHTIQHLKVVMDLYRGTFLDGFSIRDSEGYAEWLDLERERWQQRWLDALARLVELYMITGEYAQAIDHARRGVTEDPLQERFHRALMRLYYISGDRTAALTQYRLCRQLLDRELGVEPDIATLRLYQAIVDGTLERTVCTSTGVAFPHTPSAAQLTTDRGTHRFAPQLTGMRQRAFVGRADALDLFGDALAQHEPPFAVLHVTGPAGIGKSTLLSAFARQAAAAAAPALALDGRDIPATPHGFMNALRRQTGAENPLDALPDRIILLIDSYERLVPIDGWLREQFLPQLPFWATVVLADSNPRAIDWRVDLGWQAISRVVELDHLSEADGAAYLQRRAVPTAQHHAALRLARGHPLTLALAADVLRQRPESHFECATTSEPVRFLVERFLAGVPSDTHRAALEACAQVRVMSAPLLAAMLGVVDAQPMFTWLQQLGFVDVRPAGIFLHDLVRAAVAAGMQQHNPLWVHELHARARSFYTSAIEGGQSHTQHNTLLDVLFLHDNLLGQQTTSLKATATGWRRMHHDALASQRSTARMKSLARCRPRTTSTARSTHALAAPAAT